LLDASAQIVHGRERAAANGALGNQSEPALDLIEPGAVTRRVVDMKAHMTGEPGSDFRMFVCAVVIYDQMQVQVGRYRRIDVAQETSGTPDDDDAAYIA